MPLLSCQRRANIAAFTFLALGAAMHLPRAATAQDQGVTSTEIMIGAIGALTGPTAFIGTPGRDGMSILSLQRDKRTRWRMWPQVQVAI